MSKRQKGDRPQTTGNRKKVDNTKKNKAAARAKKKRISTRVTSYRKSPLGLGNSLADNAREAHTLYMEGNMSFTAYTVMLKNGKTCMDAYNAALDVLETNIIDAETELRTITHTKSLAAAKNCSKRKRHYWEELVDMPKHY